MKNKFSITEVKNFWDKVSPIYDEVNKKIGATHYQRFVESIKHLKITKNDKVLNIWSRTGNAIPYLKKQFDFDLTNLEVSPQMMSIAKNKYPNEKFELTDLENLRFSDNCFDAILSLETLEHAPNPEKLLSEFYRLLKPGHRLVMSLPPKTAELPLKIYELFFKNHGEGPHNFLSSKAVINLLKKTGFELISHQGTLLIPVGPNFLRNIGEQLIKLFPNSFISELGIRQFYVAKKPG